MKKKLLLLKYLYILLQEAAKYHLVIHMYRVLNSENCKQNLDKIKNAKHAHGVK